MKWDIITLGHISTFSNGINFNKSSYGKGVRLICVSNFKNHFFPNYQELDEIKKTELSQADYLQKNDIVFVRSNGNKELVGRCMLIDDVDYPVTFSGFCIRCRLNNIEEYSPVFFTYYFKSLIFRKSIANAAVGTNIQNLNQQILKNHLLNCPPYPVQQKIAGILSAYDDLIENNQKQIKLLEEAAQRLYKEWFVDFRFPGHETAKFINGLPEGWKKERINNFFHVSIGKTPPRNEKKCFTNKNGIPWISIADMGKASVFIKETAENLTKDAIEKYNVKIIPANSILLSFKLTVGRVSITTKEMCSNEAIAHFITDDQFIKEYCFLYLKNFKYETLGSTSSISNAINSKIVKEIPFVFPSQKILENFYNLSKDLFERIKILTDQISLLQEARDRLLPKLMNGEIEV